MLLSFWRILNRTVQHNEMEFMEIPKATAVAERGASEHLVENELRTVACVSSARPPAAVEAP